MVPIPEAAIIFGVTTETITKWELNLQQPMNKSKLIYKFGVAVCAGFNGAI